MTESEHRLTDLHTEVAYEPPAFGADRTGPGRAVWLQQPLGSRVALLWTNDVDSIGVLDVDMTVNPAASGATLTLVLAFQQAAAAGSSVTTVFDWYARTATQAMAAEPEQGVADLAALKA